jgi:SAM-dependent MidA family methyltransferase
VATVSAVPWEQAWQDALYGTRGFYRAAAGPAAHFTTATHGAMGALLAEALVRLARENGLTHVVDVGAGRGELLAHLYAAEPTLRLTGLDVVARPDTLPPSISWLRSPGGAALPAELDHLAHALVVAHEWLDVVPCPIAEVDSAGVLRHRLVDTSGIESWGEPVAGDQLAWCRTHWPATDPGQRVEIGESRSLAWAELLTRVASGLVIAVDYGHRSGDRPHGGTLTAYRAGRRLHPAPDGTRDLTAHVAMDTLDHDELIDQRTALRGLGIEGAVPDHALARRDPHSYLRALERAGAAAALRAHGGFGDFLWALKRVG